ncbi:hypothetical protein [Sphingomonas sp. T9W2]|uniref:hypothetical protein n=1 Tax=Sphingomonas sp. T9W2 TaxID=3143183 RepID=UPI0031F58D6F
MADPKLGGGDFDATPVMTVVPAMVVRPFGFVLPPEAGEASIAFGASPAPNGGAVLCVSVVHTDGEMLIAAVPEGLVKKLMAAMVDAAEQVASRQFAQPGSMQ